MRYYGLSDTEILDMPCRRFFTLSRMIDFLMKEEGISAAIYANMSEDSAKELLDEYRYDRSKLIKTEEHFAPDVWNRFMDRVGGKPSGS